ncbi:FprA family A-type flavoprotein [Candidatus Bathyarchaeota archaeon]|nr:FprA family A-type flavoprotein [Candidatus Bathyarchaeota archaeon]
MVKVFVVYDTKYGNTKLVAETIVEGMKEVEGIETAISDVEEVDLEKVADYDAILIGSPNHWGGPVGGIKKLIDKLGKLDLKAKWVAVFDTYLGGDFEKAVKKMEKRIGEKVPGLKLIAPGLSIEVGGMKGPIVEGELPKCKDFGNKIANQLAHAGRS